MTAMTEQTTPPGESVNRDNLGRFVSGVSGNSRGKLAGTRNRASLVRAFITEALLNDLAGEAMKLLKNAIKLAYEADEETTRASMTKFLLGDLVTKVRQEDAETDDGGRKLPQAVQITITHFHGQQPEKPAQSDAIEAAFTTVEEKPHG